MIKLLNYVLSTLAYVKLEGMQFELFDAQNSNYKLATRGDALIFVSSANAKIMKAETTFEVEDGMLKQGTKHVCDYGISGRELWLCEYVKSYSNWTLEPLPYEIDVYIIRDFSGRKCAVYGDTLEGEERKISVSSCQGNTIKFKKLFLNQFLTKTPNHYDYDGLNVFPHRQMLPKKTFEPLIPQVQSLNI